MTASSSSQSSASDSIYGCADHNRRHPPVRGWDGRPNSAYFEDREREDPPAQSPTQASTVLKRREEPLGFTPPTDWSEEEDKNDGDCLA